MFRRCRQESCYISAIECERPGAINVPPHDTITSCKRELRLFVDSVGAHFSWGSLAVAFKAIDWPICGVVERSASSGRERSAFLWPGGAHLFEVDPLTPLQPSSYERPLTF